MVVFGRTQETDHTQFHDQMVDKFLRLGFGNYAVFQVALDVDVQERRHAAERHGGAVLRFNGGKVAEVSPLDGFLRIFRRTGNVIAVRSRHFFHLTQGFVLVVDFFAAADDFFQIYAVFQIGLQRIELVEFVFHQEVDTVQCHAAVVTDNATTTVSIRQTGDHTGFAATADIGRINVKHALVVGFTVFGKDFADFGVQLDVVHFARVLYHFQTAERHDRAFQRLVCLQTDDGFQIFIDIARRMAGNAGHDLRVDFVRFVRAVFDFDAFHHVRPQFGRRLGRRREERRIAFIRRIVFLNKIAHVDIGFPITADKTFPSGRALLYIG